MLKANNNATPNPNLTNLIAFKPRQVLLAEHHRTKTIAMPKKNETKTKSLTQQQKTCLLHSVVKYLDNNALSKTLKRILSEAQIEGEDWKSASVDLEDLYCKYLDTCDHDETTANAINNQELQTEGIVKYMSSGAVSEEVVKKKKKKRSESEKGAVVDQVDTVEKEVDEKKNSEKLTKVNVLIESGKMEGKRKGKKSSDFSNESEQAQTLADTATDENNELTDKIKDKKDKKKKKSSSNNVDQEDKDLMKVVAEDQSKDLSNAACDVDNEKKSSKKRKRLLSDKNEIQPDNNEAGEESKPKKAKGSEKSKKKENSTIVGQNEESEKENNQVANIDSTKTSKKLHENGNLENTNEVHLDHSNGDLEKSGYKSSNQKSTKKQRNESAEPKTVNAFQRVKIDEVEFADEKLQDNSYWAKSGAEIGYGAKAQEVLGQVRGRDFRHEKTKKKRGSYRGGMIDLQSHSVKFNYSDED